MHLTALLHLATVLLVSIAAPISNTAQDNHVLSLSDRDNAIHDTRSFDTPELLPHRRQVEHYAPYQPPARRVVTHPKNGNEAKKDPSTKTAAKATATPKKAPKKPSKKPPKRPSTRPPPAKASSAPPTTPSSASSATYDLSPFIENFDMAHNLKMASKGKGVRELSLKTLKKSNIPATLQVTQGSFQASALPKSLVVVDDQKRFEEAKDDIRSAKSKQRRTCAIPQLGELAVQCIMGASLFDPTNAIFGAITGSDTSIVWRVVGSGINDPVPDALLTVGGQNAAIIEVKTATALPDTEFDEIIANIGSYAMRKRKQTGKKGKIIGDAVTLVDSTSPPRLRSDREDRTKSMEQVIAQMYAHDVAIGALTNLDHWIILEKKGNSIELTKLEGVSNGKSNALDIMLAMTNAVAQDEIKKHRTTT